MFDSDKTSAYIVNLGSSFGTSVFMSIIFVILGYFTLKVLRPVVETAFAKANVHDRFFVNMVKKAIQLGIWFLVGALVLNSFHISVPRIMFSMSPIFLVIGLGLKNFIGNLIKSIQLKILNPYVAGDVIEVDGVKGEVEQVDFFYTYLQTENEGFVTIANSQIIDKHISNYTRYKKVVDDESSRVSQQNETATEDKTDQNSKK